MGFGNLHAFNLALLAKQGWRLLWNPNSLITRVLKAKYFPTRSFLETAVSPHASVVWKSLCEARTVIIQVSKWQCYHKSINLIHSDSREWNVTLLQNVFFPEEVMLICSIPLSLRLTPDMLVCHYDKKKSMFTVKSAYHVARSLHSSTGRASSSNSDAVARNWSLLWKAIVPARVKTFWWRVISGILTTKANLARKKVSLDEECMFGGGPVESSIHILRDCPFAICAWRSSTLSSSRWNNDAHSPKDWVFRCAEQLSCHDFANFLMPGTTKGGIGVVVRDSTGKVLAGCATKLTNVFSAPQVEALAARTALLSHSIDRSVRGPVVEDTKSLLTQITGEGFTHIRRNANGVAHHLAPFSLHIGGSLYWFEEPPDFISDVLYEDCNS
ncbi:hypothetical protein L3X38_003556 [Prunus dulcis]|uniref:Reverse transcriptase zinc-binding domain-containing protein n=1 Tax=Prunus dulcis TaxID=3755 RepID=A0AAD4ZMA9_PRUDU|nr:hypothetical protein L3X38_003556 [Prunus dulcis]